MRHFLFNLSAESDRTAGNPWAVYEYTDDTFTVSVPTPPFIVKEVRCFASCKTLKKLEKSYYMAVSGNLILDNGIAVIS